MENAIERFRNKYTKKADPSGYGIMTMWKSGEDPEDALKDFKEELTRAEAAGKLKGYEIGMADARSSFEEMIRARTSPEV